MRFLYSVMIFVFDFHLLISLDCKSSVNISVMDLPASHFNQQAAAVLSFDREDRETTSQLSSNITSIREDTLRMNAA